MRIAPEEYQLMRAWIAHMLPLVSSGPVTAEIDPMIALAHIESRSPAKARMGVGMVIGDALEASADWTSDTVDRIDEALTQHGLPTLSQMRARFSMVVQRVVRRGRIKDDAEFYAVRNAVEQPGADTERLWSLLARYEDERATRDSLPAKP